MSGRASEEESVVYVVQASWGGPVKIGTARRGRVEQRLKELQTGNPARLVVRQLLTGGRGVENELHLRFAHLRLSGEWFLCTDEIRNALNCCWDNEQDGCSLGVDVPGEGEPIYEWSLRKSGGNRTFHGRLRLIYEVNGSAISDNWLPHEKSASAVWDEWRRWITRTYDHEDELRMVPISWYVTSPDVPQFEAAPFTTSWAENNDWLTHYTWPINESTGVPVSWARIPIEKNYWSERGGTKGGFIEELTGWRPSPLQPFVSVTQLEMMANIHGVATAWS